MKTPPTEKNIPVPKMPMTPGTPIQIKVETLVVELKSKNGIIVSAVTPAVNSIQNQYEIKHKSAKVINRKLRHCKYLGLTDIIALKTLKKAIRAAGMNRIHGLDDLPPVPDEDTIKRSVSVS